MAGDKGPEAQDPENGLDKNGNPLVIHSEAMRRAYTKLHPDVDLGAFKTVLPDEEVSQDPYDVKKAQGGIHTKVVEGAANIAKAQLPAAPKKK